MSLSIASNIVEVSERGGVKDFQRFINIAKGSAAERRTQIYISSQIKIFSGRDGKEKN
ncbi:MAG TPA: four helix bundle protein [Desulfosalsimonadaceae bacterium]|nr:four helix bundle protein [Desulfosalsimonadaceae bacterium]